MHPYEPLVMCMYLHYHVYPFESLVRTLRTNIAIDDELMEEELKVTGLGTKKETVELGLKTLVRLIWQNIPIWV